MFILLYEFLQNGTLQRCITHYTTRFLQIVSGVHHPPYSLQANNMFVLNLVFQFDFQEISC